MSNIVTTTKALITIDATVAQVRGSSKILEPLCIGILLTISAVPWQISSYSGDVIGIVQSLLPNPLVCPGEFGLQSLKASVPY